MKCLVLRTYTLKYLVVKGDDVINSVLKGSKQIICYMKEREKMTKRKSSV